MVGLSLRTHNVRELFKALLQEKQFTTINREASMTNLVGNTTIEIINASFVADADAIFGDVNWEYVKREEEWYNSMSLNVNDIPGGAPAIWKAVADKTTGEINSNYGWCIYSPQNVVRNSEPLRGGDAEAMMQPDGWMNQYKFAFQELRQNPESRRAVMIYTRPSMWLDYNKGGRSDFMCTNTVQYLIRGGALHAVVQMRSNDAVFGYKNDRAWQQHVLEKLTSELNVDRIEPLAVGNLYWNVGSLHVYSRHYHLVDPDNYQKP